MLLSVLSGNGCMLFFWLTFQVPQCLADEFDRALDIRACDVEIKHSSYSVGSGWQHVNPQAVRLLDKLPGGNTSQPKANNIRLNSSGIDVDFVVRSDLASKVCSSVVGCSELAAMMFQCMKSSGRNDSSLPEATAKLLFESSCSGDERLRASEAGSNRRSESFREADAHSIKCRSVACFRDTSFCGCMPEASSI